MGRPFLLEMLMNLDLAAMTLVDLRGPQNQAGRQVKSS